MQPTNIQLNDGSVHPILDLDDLIYLIDEKFSHEAAMILKDEMKTNYGVFSRYDDDDDDF